MRKLGYGVGILVAIAAVVAIVFFGRQYQAQNLRNQAIEHQAVSQSSSTAAAPAGTKALTYVAIGDSLAAGDFTTRKNNAYQYLIARHLKQDLGYQVKLDGFWEEGATIPTLALPNLDGIVAMNPDLITIELGNNEQDPNNAYFARPITFKNNLTGLLEKLHRGLPEAKIVMLTTWNPQAGSDYDQAIQGVGSQTNTPVVDISPAWQEAKNIAQPDDGQGDGYHPNDAGNQAIAKLAIKQIDALFE